MILNHIHVIVFTFSGCAITWESRKQSTVALFSTDAEYMALSHATKEGIHPIILLNEVRNENIEKLHILTSNKGSIKLAENLVYQKRTTHRYIRHHFIRESFKK